MKLLSYFYFSIMKRFKRFFIYNLVSRTPGDLIQYILVSRTPGDLIQYILVSRTPGDRRNLFALSEICINRCQ